MREPFPSDRTHPSNDPGRYFPVTRIVTLADGRSAFVDDSIEMADGGEIGFLGTPVPATDIVLRSNPPDYAYDWHRAPALQFILMLTGEIEIETGTGERRRFLPGEVLCVEDTTGRGHRTRNTGNTQRNSAFVRVSGEIPFTGHRPPDRKEKLQ